ncbi:hypothetical protein [Azospirillum brasilense]|uniref:hypothetical protein n=1 Tax=Azospirillum brasilense TaxID=192 RepID=UPI0011EDE4B0|nr:hypothetical protein [Azospirillum brasilense]
MDNPPKHDFVIYLFAVSEANFVRSSIFCRKATQLIATRSAMPPVDEGVPAFVRLGGIAEGAGRSVLRTGMTRHV